MLYNLRGKIANIKSFIVDHTLSIAGAAAEAKATGEAITKALTDAKDHTNTHANKKDNPHKVTKEQVGLGNVDNTSDKDKPVSTAQATAIADAKKAGSDAQTAANNAQTAANNAQTAANNAQTAADNAQSTANDAKTSAAKANEDIANLIKDLPASDHASEVIKPQGVEFSPADGSTDGGYIDFHHPDGTGEEDFTTRIHEKNKGSLEIRTEDGFRGFIPGIIHSHLGLIQTDWINNNNVKSVPFARASQACFFYPTPGGNYGKLIREHNIRIVAQETDKLTFGCDTVPTESIGIEVIMMNF